MESLAFDININPFGIIYNPVSLAQSLQRLISGKLFSREDLFQQDGLWHSYMHHGRFSTPDAGTALSQINTRFAEGSRYIREADFLFITLGTSWIYELKSTGEVVSNCHKVPSVAFRRFRLTVSEAVGYLKEALDDLWDVNPDVKVVFTVSPIRHTRDGAAGNQLSKSVLLLATDALVKGYSHTKCAYFPSYELVMDELRDYRFYAADMIHLSDVAIRFIWERFATACLSAESIPIMSSIEAINRALAHKPFNRVTPEHLRFLENSMTKIGELSIKYPYISLSRQKQFLETEMDEIRHFLPNRSQTI